MIGHVAVAQNALLSVDLAPSTPRPRANAPMQILLVAYWNGSSILEGRFRMRYYADGMTLKSETMSQDVVLSMGRQVIRMTVPPSINVNFGQDEIGLEFLPKSGKRIDLKRYPLIGTRSSRATNICMVGPTEQQIPDVEKDIYDGMGFDKMVKMVDPQVSLSTATTRWDNADISELPLHFCAFDVVFLTSKGAWRYAQKSNGCLVAMG